MIRRQELLVRLYDAHEQKRKVSYITKTVDGQTRKLLDDLSRANGRVKQTV
jgi:hypothetical protein